MDEASDPQRLRQLEIENRKLAEANTRLEKELALLKAHPVFLAGINGETLICDLVGGELTPFAASFDVKAGKFKLEIKYSNLGTAVRGYSTRRWSWSKPLGWQDKGKDYDYLILIGEKDDRFPDQYLDASPYVCFLIPRNGVEALMFKGKSIGGIIQMTTNFRSISNRQSKLLQSHMVTFDDISELLKYAQPQRTSWTGAEPQPAKGMTDIQEKGN